MDKDPERHLQLRLERDLKELGIWYRFVEKPESTVHTADASKVTGIDLHQISKSLMAKTKNGEYVSLIIPGDMFLDYKSAAKALNVKNLQLVPFANAHTISGYPPGGTPAMCYERKGMSVILDEELTKYETFYCGGGSTRMLLELRTEDVIRINNTIVYKISKAER